MRRRGRESRCDLSSGASRAPATRTLATVMKMTGDRAIARPDPDSSAPESAPGEVLSTTMNENILVNVSRLSDDALVAKLKLLAEGSREKTVELVAHLAELAARKLHRSEGPGRLFTYCTQVLRFSEAAAFNRIKAAKAARKFPIVLDLLG